MSKQQTAVEWLGLELNMIFHDITPELWKEVEVKFQQAKAMERENIIESMGIAFIDALKIQEGKESLYKDWEHYYNKTYGGDK